PQGPGEPRGRFLGRHRVPLPAGIVRTADAYDGPRRACVDGPPGTPARLGSGTGRGHRPQAAEALGRVLARGGLTPAGAG
ncbi:hypothetical protein ACN6LK_004067, partial [Streptomyces griseus]